MTYVPKFWKLRGIVAGGGLDVKQVLVNGAGANADIAIAGLKADAQVLGCVDITTPADELANVSVVKAGAIQLSVDTTAKHLLVTYAQHA